MDQEEKLKIDAQLRDDYKFVFSSDQGERVLLDLARKVRLHQGPFCPGDDSKTAFNCGSQKVLLTILDMVEGIDARSLYAMSRQVNTRRLNHVRD